MFFAVGNGFIIHLCVVAARTGKDCWQCSVTEGKRYPHSGGPFCISGSGSKFLDLLPVLGLPWLYPVRAYKADIISFVSFLSTTSGIDAQFDFAHHPTLPLQPRTGELDVHTAHRLPLHCT